MVVIPPGSHWGLTHNEEGSDGGEEKSLWRLLDQLQGVRGLARVSLREQSDRALGHDQETLVVREAEEARQAAVSAPGAAHAAHGGPLRWAAIFLTSSALRGQLIEPTDDHGRAQAQLFLVPAPPVAPRDLVSEGFRTGHVPRVR